MLRICVCLPFLLAAHSLAAEEVAPRGYQVTHKLAAPEAFQAAAADKSFVYAISSTQVARYDRASGKRIDVSKGPAKHLNSGFLLEGKLLLAHSNYPATPEQSQIKTLDLKTMELTTFKDFGDFGGSLVWVLKRDDGWWCNFARYGDANGQTFLVRFDEDWKELGRWTFPPVVIRQLGRMSLSGGVWDGDTLLTTDHDNPRLYRLRLPRAGKVLEFVAQIPAPFTGQGIAADPKTGGLVGIDRANRQVVFAQMPGK
jgi:hypothetical protein